MYATGLKRSEHGLHVAGAELSLLEPIEEALDLLVPPGELHLVGGPPVVLQVLLLLLLLPL